MDFRERNVSPWNEYETSNDTAAIIKAALNKPAIIFMR
jgi:hypothetical protein